MPWTTISDATLEVGKALRALTMRNLRDNFAALANGDAGAPQIQTAAIAANAVTAAAIAGSAVTTAKIAAGNVTTATIADYNVTAAKIATGAVAEWTASLVFGGVGTYADLGPATANTSYTAGTNYAGSLSYFNSSTLVGGTWKSMTTNVLPPGSKHLFLRVA